MTLDGTGPLDHRQANRLNDIAPTH